VFLEGYSAPWAARGVGFDMSEADFVPAPFTGTITIEESIAAGVVGRFDLAEGRYLFDGVLRCMTASGCVSPGTLGFSAVHRQIDRVAPRHARTGAPMPTADTNTADTR
jgi:hypothetical protein